MNVARIAFVLSALCVLGLGSGPALRAQVTDYPREALFGDLHLHTGYSFDAIASGTQTTPDDAYRYALGEAVEYMGRTVRRNRPLDFLAVTDHAEYLGIPYEAADIDGLLSGTRWPEIFADAANDTLGYMGIFSPSGFRGSAPPIEDFLDESMIASLWQREIDAAERFYEPGRFSTLVGFEWSPMPGGAHLHRNVIFRGPQYPQRPFSALDSPAPEDLWAYAEALREDGIDSVLIPHNPNMSQGLMFALNDSFGDPISAEYAQRRLRNERLVEMTQNKGTSETRPAFSPSDEFADFELLTLPAEAIADPAGGYVRQALGRGLAIQAAIGINPYRFGLIGSTDFHSGVSSAEEDNFPGALGRSDDMRDPEAVLTQVNPIARTRATVFSASGLTAVWAHANTRESVFDALQRREAFATSGTRIRVRLFAGWDYAAELLEHDDWLERAYAGGVPMGADLAPADAAADAPLQLVIHAVKDPQGANLDRIQVVKVWREGDQPREAIIDVAWSGERVPDDAGRLPSVGSTVDLNTASYTNAIGAAQLGVVWTDETFDPDIAAIYYVRVLEIPTPRWSTYLAVRNALAIPDDVAATIQERAWSSPVFYSP